MNGTRLARNISAGLVAGIAAWSSYRHMVHVALGVGEQPEIAYVLPLSVDGLLVVASIAMVDDKHAGRTVRWSARIAFTAGVLASLAANVAAAHPTIGARIVAAWPALALLLTVELLSRSGRKAAAGEAPAIGKRCPDGCKCGKHKPRRKASKRRTPKAPATVAAMQEQWRQAAPVSPA